MNMTIRSVRVISCFIFNFQISLNGYFITYIFITVAHGCKYMKLKSLLVYEAPLGDYHFMNIQLIYI